MALRAIKIYIIEREREREKVLNSVSIVQSTCHVYERSFTIHARSKGPALLVYLI